MLIQAALCAAASVAWSVAFATSAGQVLTALLKSVFVDLFLVGAAVATLCRIVCSRLADGSAAVATAAQTTPTPTATATATGGAVGGVAATAQRVEWAYCFDVHCNAYFPFFLATRVCGFFAAPFLLSSSLGALAAVMANTLYAAAAAYYCYVLFLGFQTLGNLRDARVFLLPVLAVLVAWLVVTVLGANAFSLAVRMHYS